MFAITIARVLRRVAREHRAGHRQVCRGVIVDPRSKLMLEVRARIFGQADRVTVARNADRVGDEPFLGGPAAVERLARRACLVRDGRDRQRREATLGKVAVGDAEHARVDRVVAPAATTWRGLLNYHTMLYCIGNRSESKAPFARLDGY